MKPLPVARGKFVKVDDDVFEWSTKFSWSFTKDGYAKAWFPERQKHVYLHQEIMSDKRFTKRTWVDHKNGDISDYTRENLRHCTNSQNQMNAKKRGGVSSIYKGVSWNRQRQAWKVNIKLDGIDYFIGYFQNERHAALAYDLNAPVLFGQFFKGNFTATETIVKSLDV